MNTENKLNYLDKIQKELHFSGAFYAQKGNETLKGSNGFANRSEKIVNQVNTRFGIASGCKIFTSVAICLLVEAGKISFETKLKDCLDIDFPYFDKDITIHHLLTHTSGVPDYFNEEIMDDFELLWKSRPMYHIRSPKDFLPMFQYEEMQDNLDSSFQYNNTGYILLGLIVEHVTKCSFTEFVEEHIFRKVGMKNRDTLRWTVCQNKQHLAISRILMGPGKQIFIQCRQKADQTGEHLSRSKTWLDSGKH